MRRIRISLDQAHYEYLRAEAQRRGVGMAEVLRQIVTDRIAASVPDDPLEELIGMATGDGTPAGRDHDRYLYDDDAS